VARLFGKREDEKRQDRGNRTSGGAGASAQNSGSGSQGATSARVAGAAATADPTGDSVAHIGKSIVIKGDLTGDEDIEIDGKVEGRVHLPNHQLTVGAHGEVKAELAAKTVVVAGHVTGNVNATERVEVQTSGIVDGDIRAPRLTIQEGAVVNGSVEMTKSEGKPAARPEKPAPAVAAGGQG